MDQGRHQGTSLAMKTRAVVIEQPQQLAVREVELIEPSAADVVVQVNWSGISTGTERLFWTGQMPPFPGMGYPLVPGYESVGRVVRAGADSGLDEGQLVYVPGASCFQGVRGLFGGSAFHLVAPGRKLFTLPEEVTAGGGEQAVLLALAATAYHAVAGGGTDKPHAPPDLIVGHGVLGRLLARMTVAAGCPPVTVWEVNPSRQGGAQGYRVIHPDDDPRRDYRAIYDVSGDAKLLDTLIARLGAGGEVVLAGFYHEPLSFNFAPAFMREARIRAAAEWKRPDMLAVQALLAEGRLSLDGLITHHERVEHAARAYQTAFGDADCLKMVLDWGVNA